MDTTTSTIEKAELLLAAAGISTTQVEGCDGDQRCRWCEPEQMPLAA